MLMGIGMLTVFIILLVIIFLSSQLIKLVNRIAPEEKPAAKTAAPAPQPADTLTMEIIRAAVMQITGGKGTVASVEKA